MSHSCCDQAPKNTLKNLDSVLKELTQHRSQQASTERLPLSKALNRILAEDLISTINVPPEDNSAVDGYALRSADTLEPGQLPLSQRIPAGSAPTELSPGTAARIFTGANIPAGADTVIMQEQTRLSEDAGSIIITSPIPAGQNIRPKGQDIHPGMHILKKGDKLTPQRLALIASIGMQHIQCFTPLRVAIFSTGDELVEPGESLQTGQIYNSNRYLLDGFLRSSGFDVLDLGRIPDTLEATLEALKSAAAKADVIISTGGASVGEEDYVQSAIQQLGRLEFWKVAIKPGKPFMFGEINQTPVLGLPGNPGAVFVTYMILARPFLLHLQGCNRIQPQAYRLPLSFSIKKPGIRREFLRVRRNEANQLEQHPNQSSGMLSSASWADGLAVIMENTAPQTGELVDFYPFESLL